MMVVSVSATLERVTFALGGVGGEEQQLCVRIGLVWKGDKCLQYNWSFVLHALGKVWNWERGKEQK